MGWFSGSSSSTPSVTDASASYTPLQPESGGTTRTSRKACWDHRDAYYSCLTSHNILVPPGTDMSDGKGPIGKSAAEEQKRLEREKNLSVEEQRRQDPCKDKRDAFEQNCAQSWVAYFNKRRVLEERQKLMYASGQLPSINSATAGGRK